jgi:hypothetical protein
MPASEKFIIPKGNRLAAQGLATGAAFNLIRYFSLQNVSIKNAKKNPYTENIPPNNFDPDAVLKTSELGTPVYTNLVIGKGSFVDNQGVKQSWADIEIDHIILTVSQTKKIVVTEIQGKDNDVKEYIGLHDYQIDLQGSIPGHYKNYPRDKVKDLKTALASPQPLAFASWWLQNLGIDTVVIFNFNFPQTEGEYSTQYFSATAHSDVPVEVRITG